MSSRQRLIALRSKGQPAHELRRRNAAQQLVGAVPVCHYVSCGRKGNYVVNFGGRFSKNAAMPSAIFECPNKSVNASISTVCPRS